MSLFLAANDPYIGNNAAWYKEKEYGDEVCTSDRGGDFALNYG